MKKVLLTGASGYLGARLFLDIRDKFDVVGTYRNNKLFNDFEKLDTTKQGEVNSLVNKVKPEIIIHSAAKANGQWCSENQELCKKINVEATKYIVDASKKVGAKVVFISSFAANNPDYYYGFTKKESEEFIKLNTKDYLIIRPSLIIGISPKIESDNFFGALMRSINSKKDLPADSDREYSPTYIGHVSEVIISSLEKHNSGQTLPVAVNEIKTKYEIAKDILKPLGLKAIPKKGQKMKLITEDLGKLEELGLRTYKYQEVIERIVGEINSSDSFKL